MKCSLSFTMPSENPGFVEYKRSFVVEGKIEADKPIDENALLTINLLDENNKIVRHIYCDKKNKPIVLYYPELVTYKEELDPGHKEMQKFGYPVLMVDDINNPEASIHNGCIKLWYSDTEFKGIFTSASDTSHGAIFDDGMNFTDENGKPYSTLPQGNYTIEAILSFDKKKISAKKEMIIGKRKEQLICRFNPLSHKNRMIDWCKENDISIIKDLMPGYLDSYLGKWYYHMGMLQMYRANDICLYDDVKIKMFVYLIDKTSTSYETELAHLQAKGKVEKPGHLTCYHYDIGEAIIGENRPYQKYAKTLPFKDNEYMYLCRIDKVNDKAKEGIYYLDERAVNDVITDFENVVVNAGEDIAIMGVIKPWQLDPQDFILKKDNTYEIKNEPNTIWYTFDNNGIINIEYRKNNMERIDKESIGNSVYEFYNIFHIDEKLSGKEIKVNVSCLDKKGNYSPAAASFTIKVK